MLDLDSKKLIVLSNLLPIQSFEICVMFITLTLILTKPLTCDKNVDELKQTELYFWSITIGKILTQSY